MGLFRTGDILVQVKDEIIAKYKILSVTDTHVIDIQIYPTTSNEHKYSISHYEYFLKDKTRKDSFYIQRSYIDATLAQV